MKGTLKKINEQKQGWMEKLNKKPLEKRFTDWGESIAPLYTPDDLADFDYLENAGFPGEYPFVRGVYPSMYLSQPWTMRQYSGFATAEETNLRFKYLLQQGQTGLSVAFD